MRTLENKFLNEKRRKIDDFRNLEKKRRFNTNDLITKNKSDIENVRKTFKNIRNFDNYKKNINMGHDKENYYKTKNDTNKEFLLVERNKFSKNNLVEDNPELKELVFNKNNKDENSKDGIKLINIRKNMKLLRTEKERISKQKRNDDIEKLNVNTELNKITQENLCTEETKIEKTEKKK
ncbi:hypothetical protein GVAV_002323 [Gurleya vavrai]